MKTLLVVGIVLSFVFQSFSQTFIPKIGFNLSTVVIEDSYPSGYDNGFEKGITIGLALEIPMGARLSFFPEINFSQKGFICVFEGNYGGTQNPIRFRKYETKYDLNGFEVPMVVKYSFGKQKKLFITGGPYVRV